MCGVRVFFRGNFLWEISAICLLLLMGCLFVATRWICWFLNMPALMSAYMSASEFVGIFVSILKMCWHICQHIEMPTHSTSGGRYADIYVNTFVLMLADMLTCPGADIYVDTSRCWHIHLSQHIEMLPHSAIGDKYVDVSVNTCSYAGKYLDMSRCRHTCWHIKMPAYMPAHGDADIFF